MRFDNSYGRLPERFYERVKPEPVEQPGLILLNHELAELLDLDLPEDENALAALFAGNDLIDGADPIALAYAGHQFGHFSGPLGDGRAVLLGEVLTEGGERFDIQLKGSGRTRFSRNGDGRSAIGPVIREYIVSEAMHALGVPTSRALAMATTGETVQRETRLPGGVFTRVAASHVRVGTFEYFASQKDDEAVRILADYVIDRHYPEARKAANPYATMFEAVCEAQARLVAKWMCKGFIHGVMNTDNTAISGETIDFGPCAFMDHYKPDQVYSSIDHQGRYAYNNQPTIARWNMACLGGCLIPLLHEGGEQAHKIGEDILDRFVETFKERYQTDMCSKIGLAYNDQNFEQMRDLLALMHKDRVDFTNAFRLLAHEDLDPFKALFSPSNELEEWLADWRSRLDSPETARQIMLSVNPAFIPRNHRVEQAIKAAQQGDFSLAEKLVGILQRPYEDQPDHADYMAPPEPDEIVHQTFCGT
jgi:uncharacterized protein YdiU (UPF0061 family)